jgi:hypothetical protein
LLYPLTILFQSFLLLFLTFLIALFFIINFAIPVEALDFAAVKESVMHDAYALVSIIGTFEFDLDDTY